jgi:protein-S-isoprenylcysteine O-methyltransferase Ste14
MNAIPTKLAKLLGAGPRGGALSLLLLALAFYLEKPLGLPRISDHRAALNIAFGCLSAAALALFVWSFVALPASGRGSTLCTRGPYRYVRHPAYAAFLSVFNFGLALFLNDYIYLGWALLLHPLWHFAVRSEERFMESIFGDEYREYARRTGRFVPRIK